MRTKLLAKPLGTMTSLHANRYDEKALIWTNIQIQLMI